MKVMYIMRGVPGSGKSTWAKRLQNKIMYLFDQYDVSIFSADDFWMRPNGSYDWNGDLVTEAHSWNQQRARRWMENAASNTVVVIDNTNTQKWEMEPYKEMAKEFGFEVRERTIGRNSEPVYVNWYADRNIHTVPRDVIRKMAERFEY